MMLTNCVVYLIVIRRHCHLMLTIYNNHFDNWQQLTEICMNFTNFNCVAKLTPN